MERQPRFNGTFGHKLGVELLGLKVVAVSDSKGGIYNDKGLDYEQVMAHKNKTGSVVGFAGADSITNEELLELPVTVLMPSALESVITETNADRQVQRRTGQRADHPGGR